MMSLYLPLSVSSIIFFLTSSLSTPVPSRPNENCNYKLPFNTSNLPFSPCSSELGYPPTLQCAKLSVPIDWDHPFGEHFDLGIVKLPASSNASTKVGNLFINPGGPGISAATAVANIAAGPVEEFFAPFDVIGIDPRGVGLSHQVKCDMNIYTERVSLFPSNESEYQKLLDKNRRFGQSCRDLTGPLLEHVDTMSVAKDHEAVRIALGDQPFNMYGASYGSMLGAQYAQLFPEDIRTLAVDGVIQHSQSLSTELLIEASSYSLGLRHFFTWASTNSSSPLVGQDVEKLWSTLISQAKQKPIPAIKCNGTDCRKEVNGEDILFNAQDMLRFSNPAMSPSWGDLSSALYDASHGDASAFSTRFDQPVAASELAISCLDESNTPPTIESIRANKIMLESFAPLTEGACQEWKDHYSCIGWPFPATNPNKKLDVDTKATILMVASDGDPSTGFPGASGMLEEMRNKVLLTRHGDGHTSLSLGGDAAQQIIQYLVSGIAPEDGMIVNS